MFSNAIGPQSVLGAIINLNRPPHYVHWHFFLMSVPNIIVIVLMIATFAAAIVLPFPGSRRRKGPS